MKLPFLIPILGVAVTTATPVAPSGCATVNVGVQYQGQYADYTAGYTIDGNTGKRAVNVLVSSDDKRIKLIERK